MKKKEGRREGKKEGGREEGKEIKREEGKEGAREGGGKMSVAVESRQMFSFLLRLTQMELGGQQLAPACRHSGLEDTQRGRI